MKSSELGLRGDRCVCARCGERFNSTAAFDAHRTGKLKLQALNYGRRCLLDFEMVSKGMTRNAKGFWLTPRKSPRKTRGTPAYPVQETTSEEPCHRSSGPGLQPPKSSLAGGSAATRGRA